MTITKEELEIYTVQSHKNIEGIISKIAEQKKESFCKLLYQAYTPTKAHFTSQKTKFKGLEVYFKELEYGVNPDDYFNSAVNDFASFYTSGALRMQNQSTDAMSHYVANQFDYYFQTEFRTEWNEISRNINNIDFLKKYVNEPLPPEATSIHGLILEIKSYFESSKLQQAPRAASALEPSLPVAKLSAP